MICTPNSSNSNKTFSHFHFDGEILTCSTVMLSRFFYSNLYEKKRCSLSVSLTEHFCPIHSICDIFRLDSMCPNELMNSKFQHVFKHRILIKRKNWLGCSVLIAISKTKTEQNKKQI